MKKNNNENSVDLDKIPDDIHEDLKQLVKKLDNYEKVLSDDNLEAASNEINENFKYERKIDNKTPKKINLEWLKINAEKIFIEIKDYSSDFKEDMYDNTTEFFGSMYLLYDRQTSQNFKKRFGKFLDLCYQRGDDAVINSMIITFFGFLSPDEYKDVKKYINKKTKSEVEHYFEYKHKKGIKKWIK